ncbi:acyl-CoA dehydrogenase [Mycolicibacter terrae]|uniref:Acyl-CoA dehydrogenase n=1 Tax=Mycolicibacter terrae TaxID=1788 RepID=A0AAD1MJQ5_9MYCO|nr:acyl-CoA dehydrogenase family protein [Mycolicibacter terrae]ORW93459.1 acyl-CoA dehydrogenase [Mycolicibacter terrae]BBX24460.1 acyl-CoA dehydrogenase [Mycolicibacter terrae]SNV53534.1 acyl-CoA dehydrogenase [Mycolicibacter terrae]
MVGSEELRALRGAIAELMAKTDDGGWDELGAMGLLGLLVPEQYGGAGAGPVELGVVAEELGRALFAGPYLSTAVLAVNLLAVLDDPTQSETVLPAIAAGRSRVAVAFAEGASTRPPAAPVTSARGDGTALVTGEKRFVLDADSADLLYVLATTDTGPGVFAVDPAGPGVTVEPSTTVDQSRRLCAVRFADAPATAVGTPGSGVEALTVALDHSAVALLGEQAGAARRAMEMARDYAKTRYQFGRAIGSFQAVKHMCADMLLEAESAVSAARHVAAAAADGSPGWLADLALAQAYCSDAFVFVGATNIQVHGGIGFTWEHPAHRYLRRARGDAQLFGSPSWHRERYLREIGA